jgi:hypothetical protein
MRRQLPISRQLYQMRPDADTAVGDWVAAGGGGTLTQVFQREAYAQGTTATTTSFTPPDNCVLVAFTYADASAGTDMNSRMTVSGGGLTWTNRANIPQATGGGAWYGAHQIWTAQVTTGASMTVSLEVSGAGIGLDRVHLQVIAITGDINFSDFVGATATGNGYGSGARSITLSSAPAENSIVLGSAFVDHSAASTITPASGWTQIEEGWVTNDSLRLQTQYRANSTSTSVSWDQVTGAYSYTLVALEIKPGPGALYSAIDENVESDTDYIEVLPVAGGVSSPENITKLRLSNPSVTPAMPFYVRYRLGKSLDVGQMDFRVRLFQGTTEIASWWEYNVPQAFTTYERALTQGEFDSITDFNDLFIELAAIYTS